MWSFSGRRRAAAGEQSCFQTRGSLDSPQTRLSYNTITSKCPLTHLLQSCVCVCEMPETYNKVVFKIEMYADTRFCTHIL